MKSPTNPSGLPFPWRPTTLGGRAPENARRAAERSTPPSQASHDGIPKQASMTGCDRRGLIIGTANSLSRCPRAEERRVGTEGVSKCRSGWSTCHDNKKDKQRIKKQK